MNFLNRYTPYFVAAVLPVLTFSWLMPKGVVQLDMWLLWLFAMIVVGLPLLFLEFALAKRSGNGVWQGMQRLTRDSDAPIYWRAFALLSVAVSLVLGAGFIARFSEAVSLHPMLSSLNAPSYAIAFVLAVVALILSPLKEKPLIIGLVLMLIATLLSLLNGNFTLVMTEFRFFEWSLAVMMALFSMGLGTGLYWFVDSNQSKDSTPLSKTVLPVWLIQIVFGIIAFGASTTPFSPLASLVGAVGVLLVASFLFYYAQSQLSARFGLIIGVGISSLLALILAALPSQVLMYLLMAFGLLSALCLSIFAGFAMKSSHLRKSLNFNSELRYNLWRIAVRWLVPLAIVSALIGLFL